MAEADAKATDVVSKAIAEGDIQAINYFVASKYVDTLGEVVKAPNQKVVMLPIEATSILGALGGIGELSKQAFGKDGPSAMRSGARAFSQGRLA